MDQKYLRYINVFFVVLPMTLIMAFVGIARNHGFTEGLLPKIFNAWLVMLPVAYLAAFFVIPMANRLTQKVTSRRK